MLITGKTVTSYTAHQTDHDHDHEYAIPSSTNAELLTNPTTLFAAEAGTVTIATV